MTRIVYLAPAVRNVTGGAKLIFRHVETLAALGFDACVWIGDSPPPAWFDHQAPLLRGEAALGPDDILVLPEDDRALLEQAAEWPNRKIVFCQSVLFAAANGLGALGREAAGRYREFMACSPWVAGWIARYLPYSRIAVVPGFVDKGLFFPRPKEPVIACVPRKRPLELKAVRLMFDRLYEGPTAWRWLPLEGRSEREVADALGRASLYLCLNRFDVLSLSLLEAMASQCLAAGFTSVGPRQYATPINGLWVEEEDVEACARALAEAARMADADSGPAQLMRHAAGVTAAAWGRPVFEQALETFWRETLGPAAP